MRGYTNPVFQLPADFRTFVQEHTGGKGGDSELHAHCNREFMHAQWRVLLDDEFVDAWEHGIIIKCCDGIERRFYPRVFTYSADYLDKLVMPIIL